VAVLFIDYDYCLLTTTTTTVVVLCTAVQVVLTRYVCSGGSVKKSIAQLRTAKRAARAKQSLFELSLLNTQAHRCVHVCVCVCERERERERERDRQREARQSKPHKLIDVSVCVCCV